MGEIKSVKVDNWGVFFLQKLQNFFNKTDYCDLTLQFNDNSQLKVHRLVLNACTDYFNLLEQTCEMIEDVLIMPPGLQADVVVPIVNFMYTGTLEFELKMYGRLLRTAKDMNMTVLLKLLEAHRRTMDTQTLNKVASKTTRRGPHTQISSRSAEDRSYSSQSTSTTPQRRVQAAANNITQYKTLQIKPVSQNIFPRALPETAQIMTKYPHSKTPVKGPSRFDCAEDTLPPETFEKSFDNISYESKPLICKEEVDAYDYDNLIRKHETYASPFEQLRRGYTNNNSKRPASSVSSYESPPEKKPNIQDVKEYAEQQRMRKQIAEEYDDDQEYDDMMDDEFHNDDDDDDYVPPQSVRRQVKQQQQQAQQTTKPQVQKTTKTDNMRPTIVVKDTTSTNVNHAKIISEVLRKYPHLVKNNKNIKLKIMPQSNNAQKIVIKKESAEPAELTSSLQESKPRPASVIAVKQTASPVASTSAQSAPVASAQPRRIDSKTMHALIALGAENRTGPWLCLRCGVNGRPISIPSYRGFRRHLINTHKERIDPRLCEHCGWRSTEPRELSYHQLVEHSIKQPHNNFPKCELCSEVFIDYDSLSRHISEKHAIKKEKQTCIYCNRTFTEEMHLYQHMKAFHRERATEDGVLDFSDEEDSFTDRSQSQLQDSKIKIISDISLPKMPIIPTGSIPATATTLGLDTASGDTSADMGIIESTATDDSHLLGNEYIGTDSSQGPKFVNADGNEMELTPAQREEIISQLDQHHQHDGIVMVLNEESFEPAAAVENVTAGPSNEPVTENSMFIVCGQEGVETASEQSMPASLDREKSKSKDPLEWGGDENSSQSGIENVGKIKKVEETENDAAAEKSDAEEEDGEKSIDVPASKASKEATETTKPSEEKPAASKSPRDSLEMKLKLLTDWTDDEYEEEEEPKKPEESEVGASSKEEELVNEKDSVKGEILFETIAGVEGSPGSLVKKDLEEDIDTEKEETGSTSDKRSKDVQDKEPPVESALSDEHESKHEESSKETHQEADKNVDMEKETLAGDEGLPPEKEKEESEKTDKASPRKADSPIESGSKKEKENPNLITKAELRNIMSDWVDDDDDEEM